MRARVASQAVHWSRSRPVEKVQGASFTSSYETEVSLCASIGPSFDLFVLLGAASGPIVRVTRRGLRPDCLCYSARPSARLRLPTAKASIRIDVLRCVSSAARAEAHSHLPQGSCGFSVGTPAAANNQQTTRRPQRAPGRPVMAEG